MIGRACFVSPSVTPAKLSSLKTRQLGFKWVLHRPFEPATRSGRSSVAVDDSAFCFACVLLATRQVDREAAAMICQQVREGRISLEQAIEALQLVSDSHLT
jgi:hypothetical protein